MPNSDGEEQKCMRLLRSIQHQIEQTNKALDEKQERHRGSWCLAVNPHGPPRIEQHRPQAPEPPVSLNVEETNAPNEPQTQKKPTRRRKTPKNAPRRPSTPYPVDNQPQPSGRYQEYFFQSLAPVNVKEPICDSTPLQSSATFLVEDPGVNSDYGDAAIGRLVTEIFDGSGSWSDPEYLPGRDSDPEAVSATHSPPESVPATYSPPESVPATYSPPESVPARDSPPESEVGDSSPVGTTPGEVDSIHLDLSGVNPEQESRSSASSISPISWIEKLADYERRWCDTKTNVRRTRLQKQALEDDMERLKTEIQGLIHDVMEGTSSANRATQCDLEPKGNSPRIVAPREPGGIHPTIGEVTRAEMKKKADMRAVSLLTNISISESAEENKQYSVVFTAGTELPQGGSITVSSTTARKILWALADQLRVDLLTPLRPCGQDSSEEDLFVPDESNQLSDVLPSTSQVVGWIDVCQKVEGSTDDEHGGRFEYESAGSTTSKKKRIRTRRSLRKMDFVDTFEEETPTMRLVCVAPPAGKAEEHTPVPLPWRLMLRFAYFSSRLQDVDHSFKPLGEGGMIDVLAQLPAAKDPMDAEALPTATPKRTLGSEADSNQQAAVEPEPFSKNVDPSVYKVHLGKIIHGQDTRTTLMIRNIPNKLTLDDLLELLADFEDILDFVYVPIDFKNKNKFCNVGYGFINFPDYSKIPVFYMRFQGKRWTSVRSTKICALTYGRLQGKLDLLQHFALSNVMYQPQKMRPIFRMDNNNDADRVVTAYYPHLAEMAVGDMRTVRWLHLGEKANEEVVLDRSTSSPKAGVDELESAGTESSVDMPIRDFSCNCPCALTRTEAQIQMQLVRDELSQLQPELLVLEGQRTCLEDVLSSTTLLPANRGLAERFLSKVEHRVRDIESRLLQLLQRAVLIARHLIKTPVPDEDLDGLAEDQKRLLLGLEVTADSSDGREEVMSEIREKQADIRREAERLRRCASRRIEDQICGQMDRILEHRHPMIPANAKEIQDHLAVVVDSMFGKGQQTVRKEDVNTLLDNRPDLRLAWSVNTNEFTGVDLKDISVEVHLSETLAKILSR